MQDFVSISPTFSPKGQMSETVCFVNPPSGFLLDERVFISLGILKVAAVLERAGIPVEILDLSGVANFLDVVADYVRTSSVRVFALTATTPQMPAVKAIVDVLRRIRPGVRIIIGGPHITLTNAAFKKSPLGRASKALHQLEEIADVLVAGDGEEAIFLALENGASKLIDADDPKSELFMTSGQLNDQPFPARHLMDMSSYHYYIDGVRAHSLIAQLGCPFGCGYCGGRLSPTFRQIRTRTPENIVAEILHLYRTYGVKGFMLYDDELNVNREMVKLMKLIAKTQQHLGVEWRLRGFIKAELFTDEQASAMFEAGFRWILTGFESGSPDILQAIQKGATREDNTRCVETAYRHGLKVKALMSIGHPGESEQTVMATRDWLLEVGPDDFDLVIITPYPGTPYYDKAVFDAETGVWVYTYPKTGARLCQVEVDYTTTANYYKGDPNGGYKAYVYTDHLTSNQLVSLRGDVEQNVRNALDIPWPQATPAMLYEHSMGQSGFPSHILRANKAGAGGSSV